MADLQDYFDMFGLSSDLDLILSPCQRWRLCEWNRNELYSRSILLTFLGLQRCLKKVLWKLISRKPDKAGVIVNLCFYLVSNSRTQAPPALKELLLALHNPGCSELALWNLRDCLSVPGLFFMDLVSSRTRYRPYWQILFV